MDVDRATLREALNKLGERRVGEFSKLLATIQDLLGKKYPPHTLALLATYGLQAGVTNRGVKGQSLCPDLGQHHIELLHSKIVALPPEQWGEKPFEPEEIQFLIVENAVKLT